MRNIHNTIQTIAILIVLAAHTLYSQTVLQEKIEELPGIISVDQIEVN
jgi:hypothetical protein